MTPDAQKNYSKAIKIADKITKEMSWIYANHEILKAASSNEISQKFIDTYAGQAWKVIRRSTLNEILSAAARILIDRDNKVSSLHTLSELLECENVLEIIREKYTQDKSTFDERLNALKAELNNLDNNLKNDNVVRSLLKHRHHFLAHNAQNPYKGRDRLKWGNEKPLIDLLSNTIEPMEHLLLNKGNISHSTASAYKTYAENFWKGFTAIE